MVIMKKGRRKQSANLLFTNTVPRTSTERLHCVPAVVGELWQWWIEPSFGVERVRIVEVRRGVVAGPLKESNRCLYYDLELAGVASLEQARNSVERLCIVETPRRDGCTHIWRYKFPINRISFANHPPGNT